MGEILVGTAGWADRSLLAAGWYPPMADTAEKRLAYYAARFPLVEVDATFYAPPSEQNARRWVERTPAGFTFNVKAYSLLTGHPTRPASLYADLRPVAGEAVAGRANLYPADLPARVYEQVWSRFLSALQPLAEAGKLGVVLFQFPPWFVVSGANKAYLLEVAGRCAPLRVAVEVRHRSWFAGGNAAETLGFLRRHDLPYVCVDMPQGHRSSVPPVLAATADLAVVRFHGHSDRWTSRDIGEKYGYRYCRDELAEWAPRLRDLAAQTATTHVVMNNCYSSYAQDNAADLAALLSD